mmetsp:Transcript_6630/g.7217  ORF Transcript_6630/g.7217 Transcript_6630/m.7217 type:complete len:111 (+) Transcript_6630:59-391(+)
MTDKGEEDKKWMYCGPLSCSMSKGFYITPNTTLNEISTLYKSKWPCFDDNKIRVTMGIPPSGTHKARGIAVIPMASGMGSKTVSELEIYPRTSGVHFLMQMKDNKPKDVK